MRGKGPFACDGQKRNHSKPKAENDVYQSYVRGYNINNIEERQFRGAKKGAAGAVRVCVCLLWALVWALSSPFSRLCSFPQPDPI
jgi:hypothetical protein